MKTPFNVIKNSGIAIAYDGCHKIYVCEDVSDIEMMNGYGYIFYPMHKVKYIYDNSCPLRFISNAKCTIEYITQK